MRALLSMALVSFAKRVFIRNAGEKAGQVRRENKNG
jgi:hypothetical protein